ncbi:hypothetical protein BDZ97DRAFT_1862427 [Flammula alnicola]|nr:hypothetical protein BDZ97DRAFT_1862427 [Flammula alnicola]
MVDLPPEIWCHIIRYLSLATLQGLYEVNRIFFDLAMDEKYRVITFDRVDNCLMRMLHSLRNVDIARRVRTFSVTPHLFHELEFVEEDEESETSDAGKRWAFSNVLRRMIKHVGSRRQHQTRKREKHSIFSKSSVHVTEALLVIMPLLTNIHEFSMDWDFFNDFPAPYIDVLWPCVSQTLQDLRSCVTTTKLNSMFPLPVAALPRVRNLRITIKCHHSRADELANAQVAVASFVNWIKDSLESLSVRCMPMHDMSLFYENLGHFEHLSSMDLDLSLPAPLPPDKPIRSTLFIQQHGQTVRNLSLLTSLPLTPWSSYQFTFSNLKLSNLRSLTMSAEIMAMSWEHTLAFLKGHAAVLESLEIDGPIAPSELARLLSVLNHRNPACILSKFSVSLYQLDSRLLANFAEDLQRLKVLKLQIGKIACETMFSITPGQFFPGICEDVHPFINELRTYESLAKWDLRDITIQRRSCCGELVLWNLMLFCADHIRAISSFAENGDMDIPDPPNTRPKFDGEYCPDGRVACAYGLDGETW